MYMRGHPTKVKAHNPKRHINRIRPNKRACPCKCAPPLFCRIPHAILLSAHPLVSLVRHRAQSYGREIAAVASFDVVMYRDVIFFVLPQIQNFVRRL